MKIKQTLIYILVAGSLFGIYGGFSDLIDMPLRMIITMIIAICYFTGAGLVFWITNREKK